MYGILIASLVLARNKSVLASGLVFAALLCMKHIYLYLAPAYFAYLLRVYCLSPKSVFDIQFWNCVKLGGGILTIFGAAFGPFAIKGQIPQIFSRLFPFSRGLCHAYWAPNVWAMYSFTDRVLISGKRAPLDNDTVELDSQLTEHSGPPTRTTSQSRSPPQCHTRLGWRYGVRGASRDHSKDMLWTHRGLSSNPTYQALPESHTRCLHRSSDTLWLRLFSVRMACP